MTRGSVEAPAGAGHRTLRLPFGRGAVPQARRQLVADLAGRRVAPEVVEEAESVVAELVANAVRHADAPPRRHGAGPLAGA